MNDGEGGFIVVVRPKYVAGFVPLQEDANIDKVLRLSYLEKASPTSNIITAQTTVRVIPCLLVLGVGKVFFIGEVVRVPVADVDKAKVDNSNLTGVLVERKSMRSG